MSKSGIQTRLPDERWSHITDERSEPAGLRPDVLETVSDPLTNLAGGDGELPAVREHEAAKFFLVV